MKTVKAWALVWNLDGGEIGGLKQSRMEIYRTREAARSDYWTGQIVVRVEIREVKSKTKGE